MGLCAGKMGRGVNSMSMQKNHYELEHILEHYHRAIYRSVTSYTKAVDNVEEITANNTTLYKYTLPAQTIYLNETGYPVTYENQKVDVENNAYFYRFNEDPTVEEDIAFEYVCPYEYMKGEEYAPPDEQDYPEVE